MFNKLRLIAALVAASFSAQAQTIEITNTLKNGVEYIFTGKGYTGGHDEKISDFLVLSKEPSSAQLAVMSDLCYTFDELPFGVGILAVVTIIERETGATTFEYWRSFDKEEHGFCMSQTKTVKISIVRDPKNPK